MLSDGWIDELRADRIGQALDHLRNKLQTPTLFPSNYYGLGAVYMWSGDYKSALAHFDEQIRAGVPRNPAGDAAFAMAGAAAWCLSNEDLAVKYWRKGATPAFAVAGANTRTALLLFALSILTPDGSSAERADNLLRKKVNHWRVRNWPGPIAQYIVGEISEEEVREKAVYRTGDPRDRNPKSWQFSFYKLLKNCAAADNRIQALESGFKPLLQVKGSEYLEGEKFFYFLRLEEFYLARDWILKRNGSSLA